MKIVAASGFFNPIHVGHIEYLERAKKLGDFLIVIVNTDKQVAIKGSTNFMPEDDRLNIVRSLRCVDYALLATDDDGSVCKTLEAIRPHIFAKGGDRNINNIPEFDVCNKLNIEIIDNLGKKIRASSEILKHVKK